MSEQIKTWLEERGKIGKEMRDMHELAVKEKRGFNAEEQQKFDGLHTRDTELKVNVDREESLLKREAEFSQVRDYGTKENNPASAAGSQSRDESGAITAEEHELVLQAWCKRQMGMNLDKKQEEAVRRYQAKVNPRFSPDMRSLDISLGSQDQVRALQHKRRVAVGAETRDVGLSGAASLIPRGFVNSMEEAMLDYGPMLQSSTVFVTDSGNQLPMPTSNDTSNKGAYLDEATTIGSSVDPTYSSVDFNAYKINSKLVLLSAEILEDSAFNMAADIGSKLGVRIGRFLNEEATVGNSGKINGIVNAATLGVTTASASSIDPDELFALQHSVNQAYRQGAAWMMADSTLLVIRTLKNQDDQYIFQPGLQLGVPDRLLGQPIFINDDMDGMNDDATDASEKVVLYGQLSKYHIRRVRDVRLRRLVERFADTDQEGFVAFLRCDGDLLDAGTHPVKYLQMKAS